MLKNSNQTINPYLLFIELLTTISRTFNFNSLCINEIFRYEKIVNSKDSNVYYDSYRIHYYLVKKDKKLRIYGEE